MDYRKYTLEMKHEIKQLMISWSSFEALPKQLEQIDLSADSNIFKVNDINEHMYFLYDTFTIIGYLCIRPILTDDSYYTLGHFNINLHPNYRQYDSKPLKALVYIKLLQRMKHATMVCKKDSQMNMFFKDIEITPMELTIDGVIYNRYALSFEDLSSPFTTQVFPSCHTKRLVLRQLELSDTKDLFDTFSNSSTMKYFGMYPFVDLNQAEQMITRFNEGFNLKRSIRWGISLKGDSKLIGTIGFHGINDFNSKAELGYEINVSYEGKGIITEAIEAVVKIGFEDFNFIRIEALTYTKNIGSQIVLLKNEFTKEGILRNYSVFRGKAEDMVIFSKVKK